MVKSDAKQGTALAEWKVDEGPMGNRLGTALADCKVDEGPMGSLRTPPRRIHSERNCSNLNPNGYALGGDVVLTRQV